MADRMDWRAKAEVSPELELAMMVIYPLMLATIEAAAQALLKGWTGFIGSDTKWSEMKYEVCIEMQSANSLPKTFVHLKCI